MVEKLGRGEEKGISNYTKVTVTDLRKEERVVC